MIEKSKQDNFFLIGVSLIFVGTAISLTFWFIFFGFPIFLIGAVCIGLSKKSSELKLRWILIPFAVFCIFFGAMLYQWSVPNKTNPRDILIPEGFRGKVFIIFDQPCGTEIIKVNGREVYEIPSNGVLICKNAYEIGTTDYNYYFISKNGTKKSIPYRYNEKDDLNTIIVQGAGFGTESGTNTPKHTYQSFIITTVDSIKHFNTLGWKSKINYDSLKSKMLKDCSEGK